MAGKGERQIPSQHEKERLETAELVKDAQEQARREVARLRQAAEAVIKTEPGLVLWAFLFKICGYNRTSLTRKQDNEIAPLATECKEAQRLVYIEMRKLVSCELLSAAEKYAEFGVGEEKKDA